MTSLAFRFLLILSIALGVLAATDLARPPALVQDILR
jgi:hypothetical protein